MYEIKQILFRDHERLAGLYDDYSAVRCSDLPIAFRLWGEYEEGLRRHMEMEESVLFPIFESRMHMADSGPTWIMRGEHTEIRGLLEALQRTDLLPAARCDLELALHRLLKAHDSMEEFIFTPWFDEIVSEGERMLLNERIQDYGVAQIEQYGHG